MGESTAAKAVRKLTGMWWPDADPDKLRKVADAWEAMATAIDNVTVPTSQAAAAIVANNHGPAIDAFGKFWGQYYGGKDSAGKGKGWLPDAAEACRSLAKALRDFATEVDKAIKKLEEEAAIVGATLVAGTALAFFTAGISEGVAAGAAAGIVATAAGLGVAVSETIATIAATVLVGAAFGAVEAITVDLAVAQPIRVELFDDGGYSFNEAV
ncbi:RHS repeat protein, partial [Kitasatospora sp. NPDC058190]